MKTVYSNAQNPKLMGWLTGIFIVLAIAAYFFYVAGWPSGGASGNGRSSLFQSAMLIFYIVFYAASFYTMYKTSKCVVDDEEGTLTAPENKKRPMKISDIDKITFCVTKKGRLRYLLIHEKGVQFISVRLSRKLSDRMVAHLLEINPAIETATKDYL